MMSWYRASISPMAARIGVAPEFFPSFVCVYSSDFSQWPADDAYALDKLGEF